MNPVLTGYLKLARPANLPTAAADILTGMAIAGLFSVSVASTEFWFGVVLLVFSSVFLYAGGVVLNDVFDYKIDEIERPERPIPSKVVSLQKAAIFGTLLLVIGILLAFSVNLIAGSTAFLLSVSILTYDALAKDHKVLGPLVMGICRGLNLILGMALMLNFDYKIIALTPIVYIGAITMISQGEVHGNNRNNIILAGVMYLLVLLGIVSAILYWQLDLLPALPFLILFAILIYRPLLKAYSHNVPENIKKAVKAGVLSLVVMDACIAVAFSTWWVGLLILLLLPLSMALSRLFAVT